jgi:hypothetical protein
VSRPARADVCFLGHASYKLASLGAPRRQIGPRGQSAVDLARLFIAALAAAWVRDCWKGRSGGAETKALPARAGGLSMARPLQCRARIKESARLKMKIKTTLLTVILLLAAARAEAQSADGAIDTASDVALADDGSADASDALDAEGDATTDVADASTSPDAGLDAKTDGADASVGDGAADGSKAVPLSDAGSPPDIRLFVHEDPGCSFGGTPGPGGWAQIAAGLIAVLVVSRRRSNPRR